MRVFDKLRLRIRSLFRRRKVDAELEDELRFHLEQLVNEKAAAGLSPNEARWEALRGNARGSVESNDSRVIHSTTPFSP